MPNPGLTPEVQQAIQRRAGSAPALGQQTQAPQINPMPQPTNPSELTQASAPTETKPVEMPKFEPQNRKDLITLALIETLKNEEKMDKEKMKLATQPQPEPAQASVAPPEKPVAPPAPPQGGGGMAGGFSLSPGMQPMAKNQMQGDYGSGRYSGLNSYGA